MPVYEYRCLECEQRFEMRRSYGESDAPADCPECHGRQTRRQLSMFAAMTTGGDGASVSVAGGGGCAGCAGGNCGGCGR